MKKPKLWIVYYGDSEVEINNCDVFISETGSEEDFMKFAEYEYGDIDDIEISGIYPLKTANDPDGKKHKISII